MFEKHHGSYNSCVGTPPICACASTVGTHRSFFKIDLSFIDPFSFIF